LANVNTGKRIVILFQRQILQARSNKWCNATGMVRPPWLRTTRSVFHHGITVIAPEALSRFYLEDVQSRTRTGNNRVGATWMTRENRLTDIENYIRFLNGVYSKEIPEPSVPVTVLGFSQGAATASRWVIDGKIHFDRLVLWAGVFPPDMDFEAGKEILQNKKIILAYGTKDPFLNDERFAEMKTLSQNLNISADTITFDGAHEINQPALLTLI
jgi:predicted esterase